MNPLACAAPGLKFRYRSPIRQAPGHCSQTLPEHLHTGYLRKSRVRRLRADLRAQHMHAFIWTPICCAAMRVLVFSAGQAGAVLHPWLCCSNQSALVSPKLRSHCGRDWARLPRPHASPTHSRVRRAKAPEPPLTWAGTGAPGAPGFEPAPSLLGTPLASSAQRLRPSSTRRFHLYPDKHRQSPGVQTLPHQQCAI